MADEEVLEGAEGAEEGDAGQEAGEFVPESTAKPKNDVFTLLLGLTFVAFLAGILLAGNELHDFYDVQFFIFGKK